MQESAARIAASIAADILSEASRSDPARNGGIMAMQHPTLNYAGDKKVRGLLQRCACPIPFHAVRTRFLGHIATPRLDISPLQAIKDLWGGEWPEFDDLDAFNELLQNLTGLWNHLARHQSGTKPFQLVSWTTGPNTADLERLCRTRTEELEGFIEVCSVTRKASIFPSAPVEALEYLGEINAMMHGVLDLTQGEPVTPPSGKELAATVKNMKELSRIAEKELHTLVLSCKRARQQRLSMLPVDKPTLH